MFTDNVKSIPVFFRKKVNMNNDKEMFNFLKDHFTYDTMNSWNCLHSIANNVKVHRMNLTGNCWKALKALEQDEYFEVNDMLRDFAADHKGYKVYFNGRSGGYLVLYNEHNNCTILPSFIEDNDNYEEYKQWCKDYQSAVKYNRSDLRYYVKLVQDFDLLCDEIRAYVNELSLRPDAEIAYDILCDVAERFNEACYNELKGLNLEPLEVDDNGDDLKDVSISIKTLDGLDALYSIFWQGVKSYKENGYDFSEEDGIVRVTDVA